MLRPVTSLADLNTKAQKDPAYLDLAIRAAENLGGTPRNLGQALKWLALHAQEAAAESEGDESIEDMEQSVVDEVNFCI